MVQSQFERQGIPQSWSEAPGKSLFISVAGPKGWFTEGKVVAATVLERCLLLSTNYSLHSYSIMIASFLIALLETQCIKIHVLSEAEGLSAQPVTSCGPGALKGSQTDHGEQV